MIRNAGNMSVFMRLGLSFQHLLAVFAGTIFVPVMTGLPVPLALFFSGVSTLMFHFFTRGKIPVFHSSSFTVLGGMLFMKQTCLQRGMTEEVALCYVAFGMLVMGAMYLLIAQAVRCVSSKVMTCLFSPSVAGTFIMALGLDMLFSATHSIRTSWIMGLTAVVVTVVVQLFAKGALRMMSVNCGVLAAVGVALVQGGMFSAPSVSVPWIEQPFLRRHMAFGILGLLDGDMVLLAVVTSIPYAFISVAEHVSDMLAISRTVRTDYIRTLGLPRTLTATGLTTVLAAVFGSPPTTVYTQTTGLVTLNGVCDPRLMRLCALMMIVLSFSPRIAGVAGAIPPAVIGGVTLIMYCMVIVVGWNTVARSEEGWQSFRTVFIAMVVLVITLYIKFYHGGSVMVGATEVSSLAIAWITGLLLNIACMCWENLQKERSKRYD